MATLAFEKIPKGDGRATRRIAEMTYNTFNGYFNREVSPSTAALERMTQAERETKLDQAISFLRSVPGFEKHANALETLRMLKTGVTGLINDIGYSKKLPPYFNDLKNNPYFMPIKHSNERISSKGLGPRIKVEPIFPRGDANPGISLSNPLNSLSLRFPIFPHQERKLIHSDSSEFQGSSANAVISGSAQISKIRDLLAGKEITSIPFSELGDIRAELQTLVDRLKHEKNNLKLNHQEKKDPEGKKE